VNQGDVESFSAASSFHITNVYPILAAWDHWLIMMLFPDNLNALHRERQRGRDGRKRKF